MDRLAALAVGAAIAGIVMLALWFVQERRRDAGVVDVGWAATIGVLAMFYAVATDGYAPRQWLVAALSAIWALRLAGYLLRDRILGRGEDGRYQTLRARWGASASLGFLLFFQAQALLALLFSVPVWIVMGKTLPALDRFDALGVIVWSVAIGGESLADAQLAAWRRDPANRGRTCRTGLWKYSRHPNYFFEWLHWFAYVAMATGAPLAAWSWGGPVLMLLFLLFVTGIPATEERARRTRPDYAEYQRTTSAFLPWPPRRST